MAGEWLKFEANTPEKPEVFSITVAMGWDDPDLTVGKLLKVWRWFDQQTIDGNAPRVTLSLLDRISGVTGFAKAMCDVGWLLCDEHGISLPNFDRHNGKTAKDRCLTAKRVAKHKSNAGGNGASVSGPLPKEEKKREEEEEPKNTGAGAPALPGVVVERRQANLEAIEGALPAGDEPGTKEVKFDAKAALIAEGVDPQQAADFLQIRKAKKAPFTQTALDGLKREAEKAGVTPASAVATCCERGWQGFKAEWLASGGTHGRPAPGADKFRGLNDVDHSSSIAAMQASAKRMGVDLTNIDPNDPIDF
jgi:hypothetical protein